VAGPGEWVKFSQPMAPNITTALPRVEPIVPIVRPKPFSDPAWLFEPKYDGFRGLVYISRGKCVMRSKRGNVFTWFADLGPTICEQLHAREAILDGEIVALDTEGRVNFWDLMRSRGTLAYAAFDLLWLNGRDLRGLPLTKRKKRLERLVPAAVGPLSRVPCFEEDGCELFEAACS
jgi:bifunctional non-homologous end joining protein LigD